MVTSQGSNCQVSPNTNESDRKLLGKRGGVGGRTWEQGLPNSEEHSVIVLVAAVQACDEMHQYGHMKPTQLTTVFASSLGTAKIHKEASPHVSARKLRTLCTPLFIVISSPTPNIVSFL